MAEFLPEPMPSEITTEYLYRELTRISIAIELLNSLGPLVFANAVPSSGSHLRGEIVFNDGSITTIASVDHWRCTVSGTPGTWITK